MVNVKGLRTNHSFTCGSDWIGEVGRFGFQVGNLRDLGSSSRGGGRSVKFKVVQLNNSEILAILGSPILWILVACLVCSHSMFLANLRS